MSKSIVVVGSLNLDLVASVGRIPALGETMIGLDFQTYCGGKGANQAVAVARLGAEVKLIGKLGSDAFATQLRDGVEKAGVDTSCVENVAGTSGTALITTSADGDNTIIVIPGANSAMSPEDIDHYRPQIEQASIVLGQLEIPGETSEYLGKVVREAGVPFLLDPAPAYPLSPALMQSVTWLTPNETEADLLLKAHFPGKTVSSSAETAERLLSLGVRNVILKLGAGGVYMAGRDVENCYVPAFAVHAVDTTAAGDAFNGAFAFAIAEKGLEPRKAARFACASAALSVTRAGAQVSMATLGECAAFLERAVQKQ